MPCTSSTAFLGHNLAALRGARERLARRLTRTPPVPLFDTNRHVYDLERGYRAMWEVRRAEFALRHIGDVNSEAARRREPHVVL